MATTRQAIPPIYQIAKSGAQTLQATDAMAAWMQLITKQTAAALAVLPPGTVSHTGDSIPENVILVGGPDGSNLQALPDPGQPDEILVSAGPGQLPRWTTLAALQPDGGIQPGSADTPPEAPL